MAAETIAQDDIPTRPEDQAMGLRPRTAPSSGTVLSSPSSRPPLPAIPINVEPASPPTSPPPRPARPESGVIRDINAWLDASMATASPPLMSSVPYWRAAQTLGVRDSPQAQHAIPIPTAANIARPATSHSHSALCLRRHAKRLHIPIPLTLHSTSPRYQESMQGHRTSRSMPLLVMPSEHVSPEHTTSPPHPNGFLRPNDAMRNTSESSEQCASFPSPAFPEHAPSRLDTPTSGRTGTMEVASERRRNGLFLRPARSAESTRPSTAAAGVHREDSFGDISDAPTYCSGLPPPSYRSRAPSILSTSSFGCIDAMAHAQREISRQQVAQRRGMRDRLKDFARTLAIK